jgi:ribosomal protein S18 acetylase RimI-like enzyme
VTTIREAREADLERVLELWSLSATAPSPTDEIESLHALLAVDPAALLVVEVAGELVGAVIAAWNGWRGSFFRLAVRPEHRRRGVARALVREGERRLRARGARRIDAIVSAADPTARATWRALGYECQEDRARFVRNFAAR